MWYLQQGLPQGSPISAILFILFTADLIFELKKFIPTSSFADDINVFVSTPTIKGNLSKLSSAVTIANEWAHKNKQTFDTAKTELMHFNKHRLEKSESHNLTIDDHVVLPLKELRILGVWFDPKLRWDVHAQSVLQNSRINWYRVQRCSRKVASLSYKTRRTIYQGVIETKMSYGYSVWHKISNENFKPLEILFNTICREITGALPKTKTASCIIEAGLTPLRLRLTALHDLEKNKKKNNSSQSKSFKKIPPWKLPLQAFKLVPFSSHSACNNNIVVRNGACGATGYTDGSVILQRAGSGFLFKGGSHEPIKSSVRLQDNSTAEECEKWAIILCISAARIMPWKFLTIYTDSQSVMSSWKKIQKGLTQHVETTLFDLNNSLLRENRRVKIIWIPSHTDIQGNVAADLLAKEATRLPCVSIIPALNSATDGLKIMKEQNQLNINKWWEKKPFHQVNFLRQQTKSQNPNDARAIDFLGKQMANLD